MRRVRNQTYTKLQRTIKEPITTLCTLLLFVRIIDLHAKTWFGTVENMVGISWVIQFKDSNIRGIFTGEQKAGTMLFDPNSVCYKKPQSKETNFIVLYTYRRHRWAMSGYRQNDREGYFTTLYKNVGYYVIINYWRFVAWACATQPTVLLPSHFLQFNSTNTFSCMLHPCQQLQHKATISNIGLGISQRRSFAAICSRFIPYRNITELWWNHESSVCRVNNSNGSLQTDRRPVGAKESTYRR